MGYPRRLVGYRKDCVVRIREELSNRAAIRLWNRKVLHCRHCLFVTVDAACWGAGCWGLGTTSGGGGGGTKPYRTPERWVVAIAVSECAAKGAPGTVDAQSAFRAALSPES